ncbi:hypothetical protein PoB_003752700 [Plakobranchus ocellatus]|uniref:Uncharacterized protein n=1 Tax=Plakobranchus ocellatus TaxID=259542 RepID=A0AAV4AVJ1_9GAST|nr:hypothetical protein PoB_003752700 [Plakobranchus ocellatus]
MQQHRPTALDERNVGRPRQISGSLNQAQMVDSQLPSCEWRFEVLFTRTFTNSTSDKSSRQNDKTASRRQATDGILAPSAGHKMSSWQNTARYEISRINWLYIKECKKRKTTTKPPRATGRIRQVEKPLKDQKRNVRSAAAASCTSRLHCISHPPNTAPSLMKFGFSILTNHDNHGRRRTPGVSTNHLVINIDLGFMTAKSDASWKSL